MSRLAALMGSLLAISASDTYANGVYYCNQTQNKTLCEIAVRVNYDAGQNTCSADAQYIKLWRNLNPTRKVVLRWFLDDGSGSAQRFRFRETGKGVDLIDPDPYFEDPDTDGPRRYKWVGRNVPGRWWVSYNVYVQYRVSSSTTIDCLQVDPMITNQD